jgi:phosphohistidine phosphatase
MNVYLIRHAEAVPLEESGVNADEDRPLTQKGHQQCHGLADTLMHQGVKLDLVLTSPLLRARQTAQGLLDHWTEPRPRVEQCEDLAPNGKASKLARTLRKFKPASVALVGHMPDLAEHAAWLMGSKKARIDFDKAGVACLVFEDMPDKGAGCLVWLVTPDWFGQCGESAKQPHE